MAECLVSVLWPWPNFYNNCVRTISHILFEGWIPNLLYGYIFRCLCVAYHFYVTVILTYDLVSIIIVSGAYFYYIIWCRNPKFGVLIPLGIVEWYITFWVTFTLTLTSGLISRFFLCLEHISYITANFPQMCHTLDQFLLGHSSRVCDISCLNCITVLAKVTIWKVFLNDDFDHQQTLTLWMLGNLSCIFVIWFFQNQLLTKVILAIPSKCQTVWIQIRPDM